MFFIKNKQKQSLTFKFLHFQSTNVIVPFVRMLAKVTSIACFLTNKVNARQNQGKAKMVPL